MSESLACALKALEKERETSLHHYTMSQKYLEVIENQDKAIAQLKLNVETLEKIVQLKLKVETLDEKLLTIKNESVPSGHSVHSG